MFNLPENTKAKIDAMSEGELRLEVNKGRTSRFQGEKFTYLKTRLENISQQDQKIQRQEDVIFKKDELSIARKANKLSMIAMIVSAIATMIALGALIVAILNHINIKTP